MNWKSILATAIVTGVVTIGSGMLLFWWQAKEPKLVYSSTTSIPFTDKNQSLYINQIDISNTGDVPIEDIIVHIDITGGEIEKSKLIIDPTINNEAEFDKNSFILKISNLNSREKAKISLLINGVAHLQSESKISVRGKGVVGVSLDHESKTLSSKKLPLIIALFAAYIGLAVSFIATARGRAFLLRFMPGVVGAGIAENRKDVIASILSIYGFSEKAAEYLRRPTSRNYWVEADYLGARAMDSNDPEVMEGMIKVLKYLKDNQNMSSFSESVIAYTIARIYKRLGKQLESDNFIEEGRKLSKRNINHRLKNDPLFQNGN